MIEKEPVIVRFGSEYISRGGDSTTVFIGKGVALNSSSAATIEEQNGVEHIGYTYTPTRGNIVELTGNIWSAEQYMRAVIENDKLFVENHGIEKATSVSERIRIPEAYRHYLLGVLTLVLQDIQKGEFVFSGNRASYLNPAPLFNQPQE